MKARNKRIHIVLVPRQYEKMQKLSDETGYSVSELMRRAVDLYLSSTRAQKSPPIERGQADDGAE